MLFQKWIALHTVKSKGMISQHFVTFSEYMNFTILFWTYKSKCYFKNKLHYCDCCRVDFKTNVLDCGSITAPAKVVSKKCTKTNCSSQSFRMHIYCALHTKQGLTGILTCHINIGFRINVQDVIGLFIYSWNISKHMKEFGTFFSKLKQGMDLKRY